MDTVYWKLGVICVGYLVAVLGIDFFILFVFKRLLAKERDEMFRETALLRLKGISRYVGWVERFFILTLVLVGNASGIGFVLAAKSIFRFGKGDRFVEYVLLGTLMSFSLALAVGLGMRAGLGLSIFIH